MTEELTVLFENFRRKILAQVPMLTVVAKVKAVDSDAQTCTLELGNGSEILNCRLRAAYSDDNKGIAIEPKVGSCVLATSIENSNSVFFVAAMTEIARVKISSPSSFSLEIDDQGKVVINGGELGGLVKVQALTDEINALKQAFNAHTHQVVCPPGGGTVSSAATTSTVADTQASTLENERIKQ